MFLLAMGLTVVSNVLYHLFQKLTPAGAHPLLALAVTYATATAVCLVGLPLYRPTGSLMAALRQLNWASFALAFAIVGLEVGFLLAYRAGWDISLGAIVSNVAVTLVLVPLGLLLFREKLSPVNLFGILVCIAGLVMVNLK